MYIFENIDCMEGMRRYPDKYFDLAVCDPPYGIGMGGDKKMTDRLAKNKKYHTFDDNRPPDAAYFEELRRVSKNQIIFGANNFTDNLPPSSCWLIWDKQNSENRYADAELAYTSFDTAVRVFRFRWQGMLQGDMKQKETRIHPTQKPIALYEWILARYAKAGDKLLDTHVGSGSSIIAAVRGGYDIVGFEIDKTFYDLANERIKLQTSQATIWNL